MRRGERERVYRGYGGGATELIWLGVAIITVSLAVEGIAWLARVMF